MANKELDALERQVGSLPRELIKDDMQPAFEEMANWIRKLDRADRDAVLRALPAWFGESHPWHSRAALEIALLLHDAQLLKWAIQEAQRQGIRDMDAPMEYPAWLEFQLNLIRVLSKWTPRLPGFARSYLRSLAEEASRATSYTRRLLSLRAWLTLCFLENSLDCLSQAVKTMRNWPNERLRRSGLTLMHAYYCRGRHADGVLSRVLTKEELATACPGALVE